MGTFIYREPNYSSFTIVRQFPLSKVKILHTEFNTKEIKNIALSEFKGCHNFKTQYLNLTRWLVLLSIGALNSIVSPDYWIKTLFFCLLSTVSMFFKKSSKSVSSFSMS